jgi:hypothetical protein
MSLARLRAYARGNDGVLADADFAAAGPRLRELRRRAAATIGRVRDAGRPAAVVSSCDFSDFEDCVRVTWGALTTLSQSHPCALPPLYSTDAIAQEVAIASRAMLTAECGMRQPASVNKIFSGVRGTGKSMLLRGIGACAAVLLERVLPVLHDFEAAGDALAVGPCELMADALDAFHGGDGRATSAAAAIREAGAAGSLPLTGLALLHGAGHTPLFLLDEFAALYVPDAADSSSSSSSAAAAAATRGARVVAAVHALCKYGRDVVALLATNRAGVGALMRPHTTASLPPGRRLLGYPELNNQVFTVATRAVRPIRDLRQLADYVRVRHGVQLLPDGDPAAAGGGGGSGDGGRRGITGMTAADVLHATGGCGHLVAQLVEAQPATHPVSTGDVLRDAPLFAVCCALLLYAPPGLPAGGPWPAVRMPSVVAEAVVGAATSSSAAEGHARRCEALALIDEYQDQGVLYRNCSGGLEPLVPAVLVGVHLRVSASPSLRRALALVHALPAFYGVSSARVNDDLLYEGVAGTLELRHGDGDSGTLLLTTDASGAVTARVGGDAAAPLATIDDATGVLLKWRFRGRKTGVNRLWLRRGSAHGAVRVGLLRVVVTAPYDCLLRAGDLARERREGTSSGIDSVAGILANAEQAVGELLLALHAAFPTEVFELDGFRVLTTKAACETADAFRARHPAEAEELHLARRCVALGGAGGSGVSADPAAAAAAAGVAADGGDNTASLPWSFTDGLAWVSDALPATISRATSGIVG